MNFMKDNVSRRSRSTRSLRGASHARVIDFLQPQCPFGTTFVLTLRGVDMGDRGSKDKGKREQQKKAQLTQKEKRKAKRDKKNK